MLKIKILTRRGFYEIHTYHITPASGNSRKRYKWIGPESRHEKHHFSQLPKDLDAFFSAPLKLSNTNITSTELIDILLTGPCHIWKMKLAHSMIRDIPAQLNLEELSFLRGFEKQFKRQYPSTEYEAYKTRIKTLKDEITQPAGSFKSERRRSVLGNSSDSDA